MVCGTWIRDVGTAATCLLPSGWTNFFGGATGGSIALANRWFWKRATGAAETNPLCDWGSLAVDQYAAVITFRGAVAAGDPFNATGRGTVDVAQTQTSWSTLAVSTNDCLIAVIALCMDNTATAFTSVTGDVAPTVLTQRSFTTSATGLDSAIGVASAAQVTAASITLSHTFNNAAPGANMAFGCGILPFAGAAAASLPPYIPIGRRIGRLMGL